MLMTFNIVGILVLEKDQILTDFFSSLILVSDSSEGNTLSGILYMYRKRTLVLPMELDDSEHSTVLNQKHRFCVKSNMQIILLFILVNQ